MMDDTQANLPLPINAFKNIVKILRTGENRWYDITEMATIVGFQLKLAGVDWREAPQLVKVLIYLASAGVLQPNPDDLGQTRLHPTLFGETHDNHTQSEANHSENAGGPEVQTLT